MIRNIQQSTVYTSADIPPTGLVLIEDNNAEYGRILLTAGSADVSVGSIIDGAYVPDMADQLLTVADPDKQVGWYNQPMDAWRLLNPSGDIAFQIRTYRNRGL